LKAKEKKNPDLSKVIAKTKVLLESYRRENKLLNQHNRLLTKEISEMSE
jgi:hypothetical protein